MPKHAAGSFLFMTLLLAVVCVAQAPAGPGTVSITARVVTLDGHPADNAQVDLRDAITQMSQQIAYTNSAGQFEMRNVLPGRYLIVATSGLDQASESILASQTVSELTLRLPRSFSNTSAGDANSVSVQQMTVPGQARRALQRAREALAKQRVDQASEELEKALALFPAFAEALVLRGIMRLDQKDLGRARTDMEEAVQADPGYAMGYIALAAACNAQAHFDDALRVLDRAAALSPTVWQGDYEMGKAYLGKGDFAAALRHLDKAQQLRLEFYAPLHWLKAQALLGLKSYDQAAGELEAYLSRTPQREDSERARHVLDRVQAFMATSGK